MARYSSTALVACLVLAVATSASAIAISQTCDVKTAFDAVSYCSQYFIEQNPKENQDISLEQFCRSIKDLANCIETKTGALGPCPSALHEIFNNAKKQAENHFDERCASVAEEILSKPYEEIKNNNLERTGRISDTSDNETRIMEEKTTVESTTEAFDEMSTEMSTEMPEEHSTQMSTEMIKEMLEEVTTEMMKEMSTEMLDEEAIEITNGTNGTEMPNHLPGNLLNLTESDRDCGDMMEQLVIKCIPNHESPVFESDTPCLTLDTAKKCLTDSKSILEECPSLEYSLKETFSTLENLKMSHNCSSVESSTEFQEMTAEALEITNGTNSTDIPSHLSGNLLNLTESGRNCDDMAEEFAFKCIPNQESPVFESGITCLTLDTARKCLMDSSKSLLEECPFLENSLNETFSSLEDLRMSHNCSSVESSTEFQEMTAKNSTEITAEVFPIEDGNLLNLTESDRDCGDMMEKLIIKCIPNHESPVFESDTPCLTLDTAKKCLMDSKSILEECPFLEYPLKESFSTLENLKMNHSCFSVESTTEFQEMKKNSTEGEMMNTTVEISTEGVSVEGNSTMEEDFSEFMDNMTEGPDGIMLNETSTAAEMEDEMKMLDLNVTDSGLNQTIVENVETVSEILEQESNVTDVSFIEMDHRNETDGMEDSTHQMEHSSIDIAENTTAEVVDEEEFSNTTNEMFDFDEMKNDSMSSIHKEIPSVEVTTQGPASNQTEESDSEEEIEKEMHNSTEAIFELEESFNITEEQPKISNETSTQNINGTVESEETEETSTVDGLFNFTEDASTQSHNETFEDDGLQNSTDLILELEESMNATQEDMEMVTSNKNNTVDESIMSIMNESSSVSGEERECFQIMESLIAECIPNHQSPVFDVENPCLTLENAKQCLNNHRDIFNRCPLLVHSFQRMFLTLDQFSNEHKCSKSSEEFIETNDSNDGEKLEDVSTSPATPIDEDLDYPTPTQCLTKFQEVISKCIPDYDDPKRDFGSLCAAIDKSKNCVQSHDNLLVKCPLLEKSYNEIYTVMSDQRSSVGCSTENSFSERSQEVEENYVNSQEEESKIESVVVGMNGNPVDEKEDYSHYVDFSTFIELYFNCRSKILRNMDFLCLVDGEDKIWSDIIDCSTKGNTEFKEFKNALQTCKDEAGEVLCNQGPNFEQNIGKFTKCSLTNLWLKLNDAARKRK